MTLTHPTAPSSGSLFAARVQRRPSRRRPALVLLVLVLAVAALAMGLVLPSVLSSSGPGGLPAFTASVPWDGDGSGPGPEEGRIEDPASPFDEDLPAIANLKPELRAAVQDAARGAQDDGLTMVITSGWRSDSYQQWLYDQEVARSGAQAAEGLVATGSSSRHLTGDAVDVGYTDAAYWMSEHGADYGLCQMYSNEIWHYERVIEPGGTCPPPFLDAADRP